MPMKYRLAKSGDRTVYVEHGIWYDANTKHIHVTIPAVMTRRTGRTARPMLVIRSTRESWRSWAAGRRMQTDRRKSSAQRGRPR